MLRNLMTLSLVIAVALALLGSASVSAREGDPRGLGETVRTKVAVVDFANMSGLPEHDRLGKVIPEVISTNWARSGRLDMVERARLEDALSEMQLGLSGVVETASAAELGRAVGADAILVGSFIMVGQTVRITARLIDVQTGSVLGAEQIDGTAPGGRLGGDLLPRMDLLSFKMESKLTGEPLSDIRGRLEGSGEQPTTAIRQTGERRTQPQPRSQPLPTPRSPQRSGRRGVLLQAMFGVSTAPSGTVTDPWSGRWEFLEPDPGFDLGGGLYVRLAENVYFGGASHVAIIGTYTLPDSEVDVLKSGVLATFELGGVVFLPLDKAINPFIGASFGRGAFAWNYSDEAAWFFGEEHDGVGFWYAAPQGGIAIRLGSSAEIFVSARVTLGSFEEATTNEWIWDADATATVQADGGFILGF